MMIFLFDCTKFILLLGNVFNIYSSNVKYIYIILNRKAPYQSLTSVFIYLFTLQKYFKASHEREGREERERQREFRNMTMISPKQN